MHRALIISILALLPTTTVAEELGTFTLLEGSVRVIRGTGVLRAVEGMRFESGDIVETSSPAFVQAEFASGTIAAIGPSTRVWLHSGASKGNELILMSGWLKGEIGQGGGGYRFVSPLLTASSRSGAVILHAAAGMGELFVESGTASIEGGEGSHHSITAKAGQFLAHNASKNVAVNPRPDAAFVDAMPRAFRDTLPPRLPHFAGKKPAEPGQDHDVTYGEVEPWLKFGRTWRRSFEERFQPCLKDAEFRKEVEKNISDYPEWDRVLHPEKYQTNSPSAPAENSTPPPGRY
jgi:hypothetical protein